jgi:hypothetical protein
VDRLCQKHDQRHHRQKLIGWGTHCRTHRPTRRLSHRISRVLFAATREFASLLVLISAWHSRGRRTPATELKESAMTENYPPPLPVDDYPLPPTTPATAPFPATPASGAHEPPGTADVAKNQAASVGQGAAEAGQHVAAVAKDQAAQVTAEAGRQVKDLLGQAQSQLSEQAGVQQEKLVTGLRSLRDELHSMAQNADQPGVGSDVVRQAADRAGSLAGWLDGREPAALLDDVTAFARRRPGAFLAAAAGIGLFAGRLTRGIKAQSAVPEQTSATAPSNSVPPYSPSPAPIAVPPVPAVGLTAPLAPPASEFPPTGYLGGNR